jgi:hypothetical protein
MYGRVSYSEIPLNFPTFSDEQITMLAQDIMFPGYAVVPGFINDEAFEHLRVLVQNLIEESGGETVVLKDQDHIKRTLLGAIGSHPQFLSMLHRIYEKITRDAAPKQNLYQTLRCIIGKTGRRHAYFFHYDCSVVTALLPIFIPSHGKLGELMMKPNHRKVRTLYASNFIDKLLIENPVAQFWLRKKVRDANDGFIRMKLTLGSLYIFSGYKTLHGNEECDSDKIRTTAMFHFGDPHLGSRLRKLLRRGRVRARGVVNLAGGG